jgi:hypothetical protein
MGAPLWWTPNREDGRAPEGARQELGRLGLVQRNNGALAFRQEMPEPEDRAYDHGVSSEVGRPTGLPEGDR